MISLIQERSQLKKMTFDKLKESFKESTQAIIKTNQSLTEIEGKITPKSSGVINFLERSGTKLKYGHELRRKKREKIKLDRKLTVISRIMRKKLQKQLKTLQKENNIALLKTIFKQKNQQNIKRKDHIGNKLLDVSSLLKKRSEIKKTLSDLNQFKQIPHGEKSLETLTKINKQLKDIQNIPQNQDLETQQAQAQNAKQKEQENVNPAKKDDQNSVNQQESEVSTQTNVQKEPENTQVNDTQFRAPESNLTDARAEARNHVLQEGKEAQINQARSFVKAETTQEKDSKKPGFDAKIEAGENFLKNETEKKKTTLIQSMPSYTI